VARTCFLATGWWGTGVEPELGGEGGAGTSLSLVFLKGWCSTSMRGKDD
jgi:hypothetical protein